MTFLQGYKTERKLDNESREENNLLQERVGGCGVARGSGKGFWVRYPLLGLQMESWSKKKEQGRIRSHPKGRKGAEWTGKTSVVVKRKKGTSK